MKNLKQVLALGMAFSLTMSTMAGAAFTDQDKISKANADAVELLTTLDVIQGNPDGSFAPEKTVTRAEMAKMIYTIRNGGNDNADAYKSVSTTFTDIKGHWAEGYVKYLQSTGIIAGKSATKFDPDATVTTAEAMKMALVLGGYRADKANLTGAEWLNNTVSLATTNQLTDDVASSMDGGCTRQDAAQILANALGMTAVQWSEFTQSFLNDSDNGLALGGQKITVGYKWMDLTTYVGRLMASGDLGISYNNGNGYTQENAENNQFTVHVDTVNDIAAGKYFTNQVNVVDGSRYPVTFKDGKDHTDLVGQEVMVLTGDKLDKVYGVYATGTSKVVETTMDKVEVDGDNNKLKVDGTSYSVQYDLDNGNIISAVYEDGRTPETVESVFTANGQAVSDKVKMIDWDNNGKYETVLVETAYVAEVTYVGTDSVTVGPVGGRDTLNASPNDDVVKDKRVFNNDEISAYEGIAKGDYVVITRDDYNDSKWNLEKSTVVTGTVDGVVKNERKVRVDGTWYTLANNKSGVPYGLVTVNPTGIKDDFVNKDKVTLYVVGDIAYYAESTRGNDVNRSVAMVYDTNIKGGNWNSTAQAKIILPDGTTKTVDIDKVNGKGVTAGASNTVKELTVGEMYYYTVNNSDGYSFTTLNGDIEADGSVDSKNNVTAGYDDFVVDNAGVQNDDIFGGHTIADEAIVFALITKDDGSHSAKVYTGKAVKDAYKATNTWGQSTTGAKTGALIEENNGFTYTRMMNIELHEDDQISSATNYGYLLTDGTYSYNSERGRYVMEYTFWNGTEVVNAIEETSANKEKWATKGEVISFSNGDQEGVIKDVTDVEHESVEADKLTYASITGVDGKYISFKNADGTSGQAEVDSSALIYYVNSDAYDYKNIGVSGSGYDYVIKPINGVYSINVGYVKNSDNKVKFLVIDVDGKLKGHNSINEMSTSSDLASINNALKSDDVVVNDDISLTGEIDIPANKAMYVNGTLTINTMPKFGEDSILEADKIVYSGNVTAAELATLLSCSDNVEVTGTVNNDVTISNDKAIVKIKTLNGNLTVNAGKVDVTDAMPSYTVTVNGGEVTVGGANMPATFGMVFGVTPRAVTAAKELVVSGGKVAVKGDVADVKINGNAKVAVVEGNVTNLTVAATVTSGTVSVDGNVTTATFNGAKVDFDVTGDVTTATGGDNVVYNNGEDTLPTKVVL